MRHLLYLTPYFPPQGQVGALRPLKFARHLPAFGWSPVILADLWPGATLNQRLLDAIPPDLPVYYDYSHRAAATWARLQRGDLGDSRRAAAPARPAPWRRLIPPALTNPELLPLGEHSAYMPWAYAAARRVLQRHPEIEAILVNADPYAACLVGARLARDTGLPLVLDLRDPWSVCELRRPQRPLPMRRLTDALEAVAVRQARRVILNTARTCDDYRAHYPHLPPDRFTFIRNHADPDLTHDGDHPGFDRFTLLFLGHFRRFVEGDILLDVLARLRARGLGPRDLHLVVTGSCPPATLQAARERGVADMLTLHPFVPYNATGPVMDAADLLVALSNRSTQRIPAKLYDYATSRRPMLIICDNPEVDLLLHDLEGGRSYPLDATDAIADAVAHAVAQGRHRVVARQPIGLDSRTASARLAAVLDGVTPPGA